MNQSESVTQGKANASTIHGRTTSSVKGELSNNCGLQSADI